MPETLLARFPVCIKSLWWRARKVSPLVASTFGRHRRFPQNLVTSRVREEWHHVWNYFRCSWGESLVYRLTNSFFYFSTTEGNIIVILLGISHIVSTIKMGNDRYLWSGVKIFTPCVAINFQRGNLNYLIVCFTWCTLCFQHDWFLLPICLPCVICGTYCNENKCCVVTHSAADSRVAWLVYVCTYCVPIATFGQRPNNKLLSGSFSTSLNDLPLLRFPR